MGINRLLNSSRVPFTELISNKKTFTDVDFKYSKREKNKKEEFNMSDYFELEVEDFEIASDEDYLY